ncbi:MAG: ATP-binding protein [Rhizonema sp. PD37]|nr:ATP-binding protein [Rhizonema sp. PD37]
MNSVTNLSPFIFRTLRYMEWIFAAIHFVFSTAGYTHSRGLEHSLKTLALLGIFKEGLMNIQKHAYASCVCLQGHATLEGIILKLQDDGIGFDPKLPHSGFGLKGMAERVQMLGGELKVKSTPGQGTHIQVTLPL